MGVSARSSVSALKKTRARARSAAIAGGGARCSMRPSPRPRSPPCLNCGAKPARVDSSLRASPLSARQPRSVSLSRPRPSSGSAARTLLPPPAPDRNRKGGRRAVRAAHAPSPNPSPASPPLGAPLIPWAVPRGAACADRPPVAARPSPIKSTQSRRMKDLRHTPPNTHRGKKQSLSPASPCLVRGRPPLSPLGPLPAACDSVSPRSRRCARRAGRPRARGGAPAALPCPSVMPVH